MYGDGTKPCEQLAYRLPHQAIAGATISMMCGPYLRYSGNAKPCKQLAHRLPHEAMGGRYRLNGVRPLPAI